MKENKKLFAVILIPLLLVFVIRQFYGINKNDEIFYISTVYRFFQGDAMLVHEWHYTQLFTFITYPIYWIVHLFTGSNEGIVLIFRLIYLVAQAGAATYCYCRLRRFGWIRILPALYYFVTTPFNINTLSYNTLAFGFLLLTFVNFTCMDEWNLKDSILCGLFIAGAVLSNPFAIVLYLIYGAFCIVFSVYNRKRDKKAVAVLSFKHFFWISVVAFLVCILFFTFIFTRAGLEEVLESISFIVSGEEHQKPFWPKLWKYFVRIFRYYKFLVYGTGILLVVRVLDFRKKINTAFYMAVSVGITIPYMIYYCFFWDHVSINHMLVPLAFPGLIAYVVAKKKDRRLFYFWYLPGLLYTVLAHFASDTGILIVSASYMLPAAASILLICQALKEQDKKVWLRWLVIILFAVQFITCIWQRITSVWGDDMLPNLTFEMPEGPMKGLRTTEENGQAYLDVMRDLEDLQLTKEDKLLVVGVSPWIYLNTEAECGSYSTWEILETDPLVWSYYEKHPEKVPTVIYCYLYDESFLDTEFAVKFLGIGYEAANMRRGLVLTNR